MTKRKAISARKCCEEILRICNDAKKRAHLSRSWIWELRGDDYGDIYRLAREGARRKK